MSLFLAAGRSYAQFDRNYFYYVAEQNIMKGHYRQAINVLGVLLRGDTTAYDGMFLRGVAKFNLNDFAGAEQDFTRAISLNSVFTRAYLYRAITRTRTGNYDDALKDFAQAIEIRPDNENTYFSRGVALFLNQQFAEAIKDFDYFIRKRPYIVDAYINRGTCHLMLKDTMAAWRDYDKAVEVNKYNPDGYIRRGGILMMRGQKKEAYADFTQAIALDSLNIQAYFSRAIVSAGDNDPLGAIADFSRVLDIDSLNSLTYFNRAIVYSQIGDYQRALADYDRVAEYSPHNVLVFFNRAALNDRLGRLPEAESDYTRAIELFPDFANAYIGRSAVRRRMNDMAGSRADHSMAGRKISAYRTKSGSLAGLSDTSKVFTRLLSFDADFGNRDFDNIKIRDVDVVLLPLFRVVIDGREPSLRQKLYDASVSTFKDNMPAGSAVNNMAVTTDKEQIKRLAAKAAGDMEADRTARTVYAAGVTQYMMLQYSNAVRLFKESIALDATNPLYYMSCAVAVTEMTDFVSSLDRRQTLLIDVNPSERLNTATENIYDYDEPLSLINRAIEIDPDNAYLYYNRAGILCKSDDMTAAIDDYTKAIELYPDFAEAYYNRGMILLWLKDSRKGFLDMSRAGELGIEEAYKLMSRMAGTMK
ncbi:MAG: tetratricopeptide repeat protein [Rikenellaceae bacterium]|nr:tetratricopeptide repeat protein [Rikenellaceae bacterium]